MVVRVVESEGVEASEVEWPDHVLDGFGLLDGEIEAAVRNRPGCDGHPRVREGRVPGFVVRP